LPKAFVEKRRIKVYWPLNGEDGTSVLWSELFEDPLDMFSEWDLYWIMDIMHDVKWYHKIEDAYKQVDSNPCVLIKSYYDYFSKKPEGPFEMSSSLEWMNSLKVKPHILDKVHNFGLSPNTLGVHLRIKEESMSDDLFNENPVNEQLFETIQAWPDRVLVVSNSHEAKRQLVSKFGDKIVQQNDLDHSRSSGAVQSAMIDLILLSMCSKRVGNSASTFFSLANIWSQRKF
jgi:hypothetical protein